MGDNNTTTTHTPSNRPHTLDTRPSVEDLEDGTGSEGIPAHLIGTGHLEANHPTGKPETERAHFENRLWNRVKITDNVAECWEWRTVDGNDIESKYGTFWAAGQTRRAHRVVYEYVFGLFPNDHVIHHTCGNTQCVNPRHLKCISAAQNSKRAWAAGQLNTPTREQARKGAYVTNYETDSQPARDISTAQARLIQLLYGESDVSHRELAELFDVGSSTITRILNNQRADLDE